MKTREDKIMIILEFFLLLKISLFGHILKELPHSLLVHNHSSWSTFSLHLVRGPKAFFKKLFFRTTKVGLVKSPSFMVQPHGPWCKPTGPY